MGVGDEEAAALLETVVPRPLDRLLDLALRHVDPRHVGRALREQVLRQIARTAAVVEHHLASGLVQIDHLVVATELAGTDGCTASAIVPVATCTIGTKLFTGS